MKASRADQPKRTGRPPRTDRPTRINVRLPGVVREWLKRRAATERQYEGDLIAAALLAYREHVKRRRGKP
jgi:hypothetical protein